MNIFKFLNRSGKIALSAMQAVGITAVVGAAGVAGWQFLSSPADEGTFNPAAQYSPGEVVYVSGANTGGYAGASYGGRQGDPGSSVRVSANTLKRLDRQAQSEQIAREMEEEEAQMRASSAASAPAQETAYQMGGTEGLGMASNFANEQALKDGNPMAAMSKSMSGIQDMVAKAQQQAQGAAKGEKEQEGKGGAATLASATPNWSGKAGSSGGSGFDASFTVQNSGKNKGDSKAAAAALGQVQDVFASAQNAMSATTEGARIRGRSSFGPSDRLKDGDKETSIGNPRNSKGANDLEFIRKRSADAAKNKNRAANEGSRAFLASTQISGGMMITADHVALNQGQGSKDFDGDFNTQLRGIGNWGDMEIDLLDQRQEDLQGVQSAIWWAIGVGVAAMIAIPFLKAIEPYGPALAFAAALAAGVVIGIALYRIIDYANTYGGGPMTTWGGIVCSIIAAGVGLSFVFSTAFLQFYKAIASFLHIGGAGAAAAEGAATTAAGMSTGEAAVMGVLGVGGGGVGGSAIAANKK